jgi:hypothetical protein
MLVAITPAGVRDLPVLIAQPVMAAPPTADASAIAMMDAAFTTR